jgi:hypothetical protein
LLKIILPILLLFPSAYAESPTTFGNEAPRGFGQPPQAQQNCQPRNIETTAICRNFDKILSSGIDRKALQQALTFTATNPFLGQREILVADYGKNSREERLYRVNLNTGEVKLAKVSHGGGMLRTRASDRPRLPGEGRHWGDMNHDGMLDRCKIPDHVTASWPDRFRKSHERENMTRPGFFATKAPRRYNHKRHWVEFGQNVNAIPMQGLTEEINADAEEENVALNAPLYNNRLGRNKAVMGRGSYGPAISPDQRSFYYNIEPNTVFYSYTPMCEDDMEIVLDQVSGWENMCVSHNGHAFTVGCSQVVDGNRGSGKDEAPDPGVTSGALPSDAESR